MPAAHSQGGDAKSIMDSVIAAGKAAVHNVGSEEIRRFIQNQPGITGQVRIDRHPDGAEIGASNGFVRFAATYDAGAGVLTRDLVLRYAPSSEGRIFLAYDLPRQFRVQRALQGSGVPVPEPLWLDADGRWLGVQGFVMAFSPGVAPHPSAFVRGPIADASPEDRRRMIDDVMQALVRIHKTDVKACGLEDFVMNGPGATPLECCVNWYWQTWEWIQPREYARLVPVRRWFLDNAPAGDPELTHGDSTLHNYLFHDNRLVGVLDWETSTLSRAEADVGLQCVTNELFAAPPGTGHLMPPSEEEWLSLYEKAGGRPLNHLNYFKKLAAYMMLLAIISLQRNVPEPVRLAQEPLVRALWQRLES
jgi:aminoglycoside phosphotransferase (APT) family kinase protein